MDLLLFRTCTAESAHQPHGTIQVEMGMKHSRASWPPPAAACDVPRLLPRRLWQLALPPQTLPRVPGPAGGGGAHQAGERRPRL